MKGSPRVRMLSASGIRIKNTSVGAVRIGRGDKEQTNLVDVISRVFVRVMYDISSYSSWCNMLVQLCILH